MDSVKKITWKLLLLSTVILSGAKELHSQYLQPFRYNHNSFTQQVNIGVSVARVTAASAYLEVGPTSGTNKGFLPPRASTTERGTIASPAAGLLIFNNTVNRWQGYNGTTWVNLNIDTSGQFIKSITRIPGKDSLFFNIGGTWYAIKDSVGSNVVYVDSVFSSNDSLKYKKNGTTYFVKKLQPYGTYLVPADTANKWVNRIERTAGKDSIFFYIGGTRFAIKDSTSAPVSGEANTGSNLGGGLANYANKSGVDLQFNSFSSTDFKLNSNLFSIDSSRFVTVYNLTGNYANRALSNLSSVAINTSLLPGASGINLGDIPKPFGYLYLSQAGQYGTTVTVLQATQTVSRAISLPDATTTLLGTNNVATVTNKTITASTNTLGGVTMGIGGDASYDTYYRHSDGTLKNLANGITGQVLGSNTSAAPSWKTLRTINGNSLFSGTDLVQDLQAVTTAGNTTTNAVEIDNYLNLKQALYLTGDVTPSQITSDQNNYNPGSFSNSTCLRLSSDASRNITGLQGNVDGAVVFLHNVGSYNIVLKNENTNSTAAYRFALSGDVTIGPNQTAFLRYDATSTRWRVLSEHISSGAGLRFGKSGEDTIATGNRFFDTDAYKFTFSGGANDEDPNTPTVEIINPNSGTALKVDASDATLGVSITDAGGGGNNPYGLSVSLLAGTGNGVTTYTNGLALAATSLTKNAAYFSSEDSVTAMFYRNVGDSTSIKSLMRLTRGNNLTGGSDGIGGSVDFWLKRRNALVPAMANRLISKWTNSGDAILQNHTSNFDINGVDAGTEKVFANFQTGGIIRTNNNADTLATKAYARSAGGGGSGANTALSNLSSVAINAALVLGTSDAFALGSTTKQWSDLFLAEGGVINWDNGDATLTQVGDVVTLAGADLKITTPGTASTSVLTTDGTQTLTNKRITDRTGSTTSSATPTINTDNVDVYHISAQAAAITSFTTNLSGTPGPDDKLLIYITDDGTSRAITWGASFENGAVTLPTATTISTTLVVGFFRNQANNKWMCMAKSY